MSFDKHPHSGKLKLWPNTSRLCKNFGKRSDLVGYKARKREGILIVVGYIVYLHMGFHVPLQKALYHSNGFHYYFSYDLNLCFIVSHQCLFSMWKSSI